MIEFLTQLQFWHWLILGAALVAVEAFAPGAFFLWPGLSAVFIGILTFLIPGLGWQASVSLWAALSLIMAVGWIVYRKRNPPRASEQPALNRRGEQYVGRTFTLAAPIINGRGELRIDDTMWRVGADEDYPAGTQVHVTGVEGTALRITDSISPTGRGPG